MTKWVERSVHGLEILIGCLLALIGGLVCVLVALRYLFNSTIAGANEVVTILFIYATALGAAVGVARWEHIGLTFLLDRVGPRSHWLLEIVRTILVGVVNGVMVFYSLIWIRTTGGFLMPSTGLPRWTVQMSVPIGCGLVVVYCLCRVISLIRRGAVGVENNSQQKG